MNIIHILPELEDGGVERLVPVYANEQALLGHNISVISAGGKLESLLSPEVRHIRMPVHRKNPAIGLLCAFRLARIIARGDVSVIHAHSRVPAWICCVAKRLAPRVKFFFTAHSDYAKYKLGMWPVKHADGVTCVSQYALNSLLNWLPANVPTNVIYNPVIKKLLPWRGGSGTAKRLLYAGRLSPKKFPLAVLEALARHREHAWVLDIFGDGPFRQSVEDRARELGIGDRVILHGFSDNIPEILADCDLLLHSSMAEGFGLTLLEALLSGVPVIASDLPATRELTGSDGTGLLPPGDAEAWSEAFGAFFDGKYVHSLKLAVKLPTPDEAAKAMIRFYGETVRDAVPLVRTT
ncbi:MAG: glycosyltransferase family 4 protein [Synergistaceae bacterium]|jgi:glycosyltransferase involved in cell wall biosynthesis|nr:glycosyltransferase family 4 protein [Synergistaceae bacterium]MDR1515503.1 glycosyltransferase family 4 protein [Synergistaceae bacterium]